MHTSDIRLAKRLWLDAGGRIEQVRCTGEVRYVHLRFDMPLRVNNRRKDVPAKLLSRLSQLARAA
jgi:hypothetical protein